MALYDMSEADKQFLRSEMRAALRPILDELKGIRNELDELKKGCQVTPKSGCFAYAYTQIGTADEQAQKARRAEATTLYDGAAIEKEDADGSDEVVGSGKTD